MKFQFGFLLASLLASGAHAYPSGAGACPGGMPAVGGPHKMSEAITTGSLEEGGVQVRLNGSPITDMTMLTPAEMAYIQLTSTVGSDGFKGFLIRVGPMDEEDSAVGRQTTLDLTMALSHAEDDFTIQEEPWHCAADNAAGLTHTNNDFKTSVTGMLEIPQPILGGVMLDVTVVMSAGGGVSEYYHTSYMLAVGENEETAIVEEEEDAMGQAEDMDNEETAIVEEEEDVMEQAEDMDNEETVMVEEEEDVMEQAEDMDNESEMVEENIMDQEGSMDQENIMDQDEAQEVSSGVVTALHAVTGAFALAGTIAVMM